MAFQLIPPKPLLLLLVLVELLLLKLVLLLLLELLILLVRRKISLDVLMLRLGSSLIEIRVRSGITPTAVADTRRIPPSRVHPIEKVAEEPKEKWNFDRKKYRLGFVERPVDPVCGR